MDRGLAGRTAKAGENLEMLCGHGVVAIWNGIADEGRSDFYAWHLTEHMPERVGIPGFLRGRRYRAAETATHPEFFTLYEVECFEVLVGQDYANRLNAPTPWTKRATSHFRDTSRGLGRVLTSVGPGSGGVLATIRFAISPANEMNAALALLSELVRPLARLPMITGAHLIHADDAASGIKTTETRARSDILSPPSWIVLIEACGIDALEEPVRLVTASPLVEKPQTGRYRHEYTRLKMDWTPG
jgi:hypothetical protein